MSTHCKTFAEGVDLIAMDETALSVADATHLDSCAECRGLLRRARAVEAALAARPLATPPSTFTASVLTAVRGERWRAEQVLDLGFNVAIAAGLLLIVVGVAALAWRSGVIAIGGDLAALISAGVTMLADRVAPQTDNVVVATLLLATALGVWWWAEGIEV